MLWIPNADNHLIFKYVENNKKVIFQWLLRHKNHGFKQLYELIQGQLSKEQVQRLFAS